MNDDDDITWKISSFRIDTLTIAMLQPQTTTNATTPTLQQRQIFRIFNFNIIMVKPRKMLLSKLTLEKLIYNKTKNN